MCKQLYVPTQSVTDVHTQTHIAAYLVSSRPSRLCLQALQSLSQGNPSSQTSDEDMASAVSLQTVMSLFQCVQRGQRQAQTSEPFFFFPWLFLVVIPFLILWSFGWHLNQQQRRQRQRSRDDAKQFLYQGTEVSLRFTSEFWTLPGQDRRGPATHLALLRKGRLCVLVALFYFLYCSHFQI